MFGHPHKDVVERWRKRGGGDDHRGAGETISIVTAGGFEASERLCVNEAFTSNPGRLGRRIEGQCRLPSLRFSARRGVASSVNRDKIYR